MSRFELLEPFLEDGILNTNFFNGRLLSAEDLRTEQQAALKRAAHLGAAVGAGVARGLRVGQVPPTSPPGTLTSAAVTVSKGLGLNAAGQTLWLPADAEVKLVRERETAPPEAGLFTVCQPPRTQTVAAGAGVYVLAVRPASGFQGKAPLSGLGGTGLTSPGCGSRYAVGGVQFKLADLSVADNRSIDAATRARLVALMGEDDAPSLSLLRNELAHACFGTARLASLGGDPYAEGDDPHGEADDPQTPADERSRPTPAYGALEDLYRSCALDDCDLPLALVYWSKNGIEFIDEWAVRRRVTRGAAFERWSPFADERRESEGGAAFQQFQDQIETLPGAPGLVRARAHFRYLPAAGVIPAADDGAAADAFRRKIFFAGMTYREPVHMDGARLAALLRLSFTFAPVDTESGEMLWLYWVVQNARASDATGSVRRYLVFTNGHMPWAGEARFDLARWDYSNYV
ncbi:MAG: hypothetical protein LC800_01725 [Acidobacteria bacterium]|nr:hypothetical protein [Acidobacteriota bacterium]